MDDRRPCAHSHKAHANQNAAGAIVKTPTTEITLTAISGAEMTANGSFHRFHAIRHTAKPAASQTAAITLDVTQSQVTTGESLFAEQPHGLEAITKTDSSTAANAHAPKTKAMTLVVRRYAFGGAAVTTRLSLWGAKTSGHSFDQAKPRCAIDCPISDRGIGNQVAALAVADEPGHQDASADGYRLLLVSPDFGAWASKWSATDDARFALLG
jgi:hypothetical protein